MTDILLHCENKLFNNEKAGELFFTKKIQENLLTYYFNNANSV